MWKRACTAVCIAAAVFAVLQLSADQPSAQSGAASTAKAAISTDRFRRAVTTLSSDAMQGRAVGTEGGRRAASHIASTFSSIGLRPGAGGGFRQSYRHSFHGTASAANVIGMLPGSDPELKGQAVLVVAHYDHLGNRQGYGCPSDPVGQCLKNGANDNATGVAALFELARAFVAVKGQLDRTVYFIALDGEECGCTGSNHYAFRAPAHPVARTVYVLNIDQIGQGGGLTSHSGHGGYGDDCEVDGEVFARAGMRAQTLVGSNDHYHQCGDTAGTVNYQSAISTVRRAFDLVWSAAQGGGQSSSSVSATPPASSAPSTSSPSPPAASPGRSSPMDSTDTMPR